eukprot:874371-Amphidinium_carterae.2
MEENLPSTDVAKDLLFDLIDNGDGLITVEDSRKLAGAHRGRFQAEGMFHGRETRFALRRFSPWLQGNARSIDLKLLMREHGVVACAALDGNGTSWLDVLQAQEAHRQASPSARHRCFAATASKPVVNRCGSNIVHSVVAVALHGCLASETCGRTRPRPTSMSVGSMDVTTADLKLADYS